jgi:hypothetical protein
MDYCKVNIRNCEALKLKNNVHELTVTPQFKDGGWYFFGKG